jgi:hypothetical protein
VLQRENPPLSSSSSRQVEEASSSRRDCPRQLDLDDEPLGTPTDPWSDPNAALWLSIRPTPPPPWPARLRERVATFSFATLRGRLGQNLPSWVAARATRRDWVSSTILGLAIGLGVGIGSRAFVSEPSGPPLAAARLDMHARQAPPAASVEHDDPGVSDALASSLDVVRAGEAEPLAPSGAMSEPERQTLRTVVREARPRAARPVVRRAQPQVNAKPASRVRRGNATKRRSKAWARRDRKLRR